MSKKEIARLLAIAGPPAEIDSRICFGIKFYDSEEKAEAYAKVVRMQGDAYNGGWFHGMACGRDTSFDYVRKDGVKLYAVTTA